MRDFIPVEPVADALAGVGIFLVALVVFSFIANIIAAHVRSSSLSPLDRTLGLLFGFVRGAVIVCLAFLFITWIVKANNMPAWAYQAQTYEMVESGAKLLASVAPRNLRDQTAAAAETARTRAQQAIEAERATRQLMSPPKVKPQSGAPSGGYSESEREEMDRLIRSKQ